jgi:hypothetical protein
MEGGGARRAGLMVASSPDDSEEGLDEPENVDESDEDESDEEGRCAGWGACGRGACGWGACGWGAGRLPMAGFAERIAAGRVTR